MGGRQVSACWKRWAEESDLEVGLLMERLLDAEGVTERHARSDRYVEILMEVWHARAARLPAADFTIHEPVAVG